MENYRRISTDVFRLEYPNLSYEVQVPVNDNYDELIIWVNHNCTGKFDHRTYIRALGNDLIVILFEKEDDAALFKLVWC